MKYYNLETDFGEFKVTIEKEKYSVRDNLALELITDEGEPFATLTTNLVSYDLKDNEAFVDTNNCPWAEKFIEDNKLGKKMKLVGESGYCKYPLYQFYI